MNYLTIDRLHSVTFPCLLKVRVADPCLIIFRQAEKANLKEKLCHTHNLYNKNCYCKVIYIVDRFTKINHSLQVFANLQKCGKSKFIRFGRFLWVFNNYIKKLHLRYWRLILYVILEKKMIFMIDASISIRSLIPIAEAGVRLAGMTGCNLGSSRSICSAAQNPCCVP